MSDVSKMPSDWWPESVTVTGKSSGDELGYCFFDTSPDTSDYKDIPQMFALREALWRMSNDEQFRRDIEQFREALTSQ